MKFMVFFFIAVIVCFVFSSCHTYRYIYAASPANDPYFKHKGESQAAAFYSSSAGAAENIYARGIDLQGAYAITNHVAVTAGFFNRSEKDANSSSYSLFDTSTIHYRRNLADAGAGYFVALGKAERSFFNIYGGMAFGKFKIGENGIDNNGDAYSRFQITNITKFYIQPAFNFMPSRYFHYSFTYKVSFIHYGAVQSDYTADEKAYFGFDRVKNKTVTCAEPSFNLEIGIPQASRLKLTGNISFATNPFDRNTGLHVRGGCFSIGINIDPAKFKAGRQK